MAGDAIVSAVVGDMVGRLMSLVAGQLRDRRGVEEKLRRIQGLLVRIENAVEAAEARRITGRALLAWLSELADGAIQGRYFLEACGSGEAPGLPDDEDGGHGEVARSFSLANPFNPAKRLRVAARRLVFRGGSGVAELDSVLADLESVSGDLTGFIMLLQSCPPALHRPLATNIYADIQMFGRRVERRQVIDFLLQDGDDDGGETAEAELGVLPIIGRPGLGKTTLVQHVSDEPAVRRRFSLIILLDFHCMSLMSAGETTRLMRSLFTPAGMASTSLTGVSEPLRLLEQKLRGERFLAVFDNVDACRRQVIDAIMPAEYWFFFKVHAFADADAEANTRLAAAGQAIAERLRLRSSFFGGKMMGALLRSRPDPRLWRRVLSSGAADLRCVAVAAADCLFPPHVSVHGVTMSASPVRGFVGLQDSFFTTPPTDSGGRRRRSPELPVLLCKLVFPSYCLHYTVHCSIDDTGRKQ
ncbi:hypothetical protein ABZP36_032072 [Zizania latifolia]